MDIKEWEQMIGEERVQKDQFFKFDFRSPLPWDQRESFDGLKYFPPDEKYRFKLKLFEHAQKKVIEIEDTKGYKRKFIRWGELRFSIDGIDGTECTLQAYKTSPEKEELFVPFKDLTSGKQTYGAGRYLDLDPAQDKMADGKWVLCFNRAYNPWCAYSNNYACPFTPPENWLNVPILAGEKKYH